MMIPEHPDAPRGPTAVDTARACLHQALAGLGEGGVERRHEVLMEWAETELGLRREYAENVYAVAEEEDLEPVYAFRLIGCGVGVLELETPEQDPDESSTQQAPPDWLGEETVELDDVALERRLRATFRRFRAQVEAHGGPEAAVDPFLAEPDVGPVRMR